MNDQLRIREVLIEELSAAGLPLGPDAAARAVDVLLQRLVADDVTEHLVTRINAAFHQAASAWNLRDDIFAYPGTPETAARVALDGVRAALGAEAPSVSSELSPEQADEIVRTIEYRGWRFRVDAEPPLPLKVTVTADVENTHRPGETFTLSRSAPIRGRDVAAAAFDAVMRIEEHEAMERFRVRSDRVLDPHRAPEDFVGPQRITPP